MFCSSKVRATIENLFFEQIDRLVQADRSDFS